MKRKLFNKISKLLFALFLLALLSSCSYVINPGNNPDETESSTQNSSETTSEQNPIIEQLPSEVLYSTELYYDGSRIIYRNPYDSFIYSSEIGSESVIKLFPNKVLGEFIVSENYIWFSDIDSGCVCCGNIFSGEVYYYYRLPFTKCIFFADTFYLYNGNTNGTEESIYKYNVLKGEWETRVLSGSITSPFLNNIIFAEENIFSVSVSENQYSIFSVDYETFETEKMYTAEPNSKITDLFLYDGNLYFTDGNGNICCLSLSNKDIKIVMENAVRLLGVSKEGLLYKKSDSYSSKLYLGSFQGKSSDVRGGLVLAAGHSRSVTMKNYSSSYVVSLNKYPEDIEIASSNGIPVAFYHNEDYVMISFLDDDYSYLFDLKAGEIQIFYTGLPDLISVQPNEYLSCLENQFILCPDSLYDLDARTACDVILKALSKNDRYTLNLFISNYTYLTPFEKFPFKSASYNVDNESSTSISLSLMFSFYNEDEQYSLLYMPKFIRNGKLNLVYRDSHWTFDFLS